MELFGYCAIVERYTNVLIVNNKKRPLLLKLHIIAYNFKNTDLWAELNEWSDGISMYKRSFSLKMH